MPNHAFPAKRERLAYLLGNRLTNIAEVRQLVPSEISAIFRSGIEMHQEATPENTYLVRLGFDYRWWQLPIKSLDSAIAAELVFSLWIRRRDAHSFNRVYVNGIPVFFDHLTSLLGEPELASLDKFFTCGPDAGYAAWWRIEQIDPRQTLNLLQIRSDENHLFNTEQHGWRVLCPVKRKDRTKTLLTKFAGRIQRIPPTLITAKAIEAGFCKIEAENITYFLTNTARELDQGIERLWEQGKVAPTFS